MTARGEKMLKFEGPSRRFKVHVGVANRRVDVIYWWAD